MERIDDLQCRGLKVISNPDVFCFGIDAVLLANYATATASKKVLDMGTGNGIIPILMTAKCGCRDYTGLELQDLSYDLAVRSVELNGLEGTVRIVKGDIKEASAIFGKESFDVVTTNPPYMNENHGLVNPDSCKAIARHELKCTLKDVVREASAVLKQKGTFYMVHRPHRIVDIICTMREYDIEPKEIVMVHPHLGEDANIMLVMGVKGAGAFTKVKHIIIYDENGQYTDVMNNFIRN
ncbi:MAG: tRNA1(Val) (adenine(37)-N6)-methyltransferase [Lachnospiraceae bacterium]